MKRFRGTRRDLYGRGTPGHSDASARQGYYVSAPDEASARAEIRRIYRLSSAEGIDLEDLTSIARAS